MIHDIRGSSDLMQLTERYTIYGDLKCYKFVTERPLISRVVHSLA
jgi:hypothetical protein